MMLNSNIATSDTGFIFNPNTGDSFSTNKVGLEIIRLLKNETTKDGLVKSIQEIFSIDLLTVDKDIIDFLIMLKNFQLLSEDE